MLAYKGKGLIPPDFHILGAEGEYGSVHDTLTVCSQRISERSEHNCAIVEENLIHCIHLVQLYHLYKCMEPLFKKRIFLYST